MNAVEIASRLKKVRGLYQPILLLDELSEMLASMPWAPLPAPAGSSTCVTLSSHKLAALCYDKVWHPFDCYVPDSIRFAGAGVAEFELTLFNFETVMWDPDHTNRPLALGELDNLLMFPLSQEQLKKPSSSLSPLSLFEAAAGMSMMVRDITQSQFCRYLAMWIRNEQQCLAIPEYPSLENYEGDFGAIGAESRVGTEQVLFITLSNLNTVDEDALSWEQVLEFRADIKRQADYRRLVHWLQRDLLHKSPAFIEDEILHRLEDYEAALKVHGIKTISGLLAETIDGRFITGTAIAGGGIAHFAEHPVLGAIVAGALTLGKLGLSAVECWIHFEDFKARPEIREAAFIHEIKKLGDANGPR